MIQYQQALETLPGTGTVQVVSSLEAYTVTSRDIFRFTKSRIISHHATHAAQGGRNSQDPFLVVLRFTIQRSTRKQRRRWPHKKQENEAPTKVEKIV